MNPKLTRQLGNRPIPLDHRQRHLCLNAPVRFLRVRFISCSCATGAF
jgi:hypothetical protein